MVKTRKPYWASLETWSPTLFLLGGGLLVGHAAIRGLQAFTDISSPADVFGPAGFLLALVGLYGLYPPLVDRAPKLARAGAAVGAVLLVGWTVIFAWGFGQILGELPPQSEVFPGVFFMVQLVAIILTYGLFGAAALRTDVYSMAVGLLLFVPPVLIFVLLADVAILGDAGLGALVVGSAQAVAHLAIGYSLRIRSSPGDQETPAGSVTTG